MATEAKPLPPIPSFDPVEAERNGVKVKLVLGQETAGLGRGRVYLASDRSFSTEELIKLMGEDYVNSTLNKEVKWALKDIGEECSPKDAEGNVNGLPDHSKIAGSLSTYSFVSESIKVLTGRLLAVMEKLMALPDDASEGTLKEAIALKSQAKAIKRSIESKQRPKDDDAE